jgi:hypothetical protein
MAPVKSKLDAVVPPALRAWQVTHLPAIREKRGLTDADMEARREANRQLCAILDELAQPLGEAAAGARWRDGVHERSHAARLLDRAADQPCDHRFARFSAMLTIAAHSALPGLVWRAAARFEGFSLRPSNGDSVVKPWEIAKAACTGKETGSLAFLLLGQECDLAIDRYMAPSSWTPDTLEPWLRPRWPAGIQA